MKHCIKCTAKMDPVRRSQAAVASGLCFTCYAESLLSGMSLRGRNCPACKDYKATLKVSPCQRHLEAAT